MEKVESEVIFEISYGDNSRRIDPFKKNKKQKNCFWRCQPCLFPESPCVVCKALAASLVCDEWRASHLPLALTWHKNTHIPVILLWYLQVLARASEQRGMMTGSRERQKVE